MWVTSTGTRRRRSAAAGRCVYRTQWCGRPIELQRCSGTTATEEATSVDSVAVEEMRFSSDIQLVQR